MGINKKNISFYVTGFFAFAWFLIRSGSNPKRLSYPCQQAAFPIASAWFATVIAIPLTGSMYMKQVKDHVLRFAMPLTFALASVVVLDSVVIPVVKDAITYQPVLVGGYPIWESNAPVSDIFYYDNIPTSAGSLAAGDGSVNNAYLNDVAIDSLILLMESNGTYFYKTSTRPTGIVGENDVVIIKGNFQWRGRLSTNTDRIKGVIWAILQHPDGFGGEILVVDNGSGQEQPPSYYGGLTDYANNSDDTDQSIVDVVDVFKAKGFPVDTMLWDNLNENLVDEYSDADLENGYVYNSTTKVNYPKFQTPGMKYVSLKYGIWNTGTSTYDLTPLTIINMPVLKAHEIGGATIAVKNWIGVMNNIYTTSWYGGYNQFHDNYVFEDYALPARVMDEIWPKLNIVDATYTATRNNYEPGSPTTKTNIILASTDPVAVSYYAAKYILKPIAQYTAKTDPDITTDDSHYGQALLYWHDYFQTSTDKIVTMDEAEMTIYSVMGEGGEPSTYRYVTPQGKRYFIDGIQKVIKIFNRE